MVGLDIGTSRVKLVELTAKGASIELTRAAVELTPVDVIRDGKVVQPEQVAAVIKKALAAGHFRPGEVVAAMIRKGRGWRTNIAQGARAEPFRPDEAMEELALRAVSAVGAFYAGVDLMKSDDGRLHVVEVNGIPGWKGLEAATGIAMADIIVDRALARLEEDRP